MLGGSYQDDNGHGTHVAGTVLGGAHGVASGAIIHPVKVSGTALHLSAAQPVLTHHSQS
jgi:subtilisin family serine protease